MKVLISAYACEPNKGSEPGAGWQIVNALTKYHDIWVITRRNNKQQIEKVLSEKIIKHLNFTYHDLWPLTLLKKSPGGVYWYHYIWQLSLLNIARTLHRRIGFDLAHQLTFGSFRFPSSLQMLGIPIIIGPVGGAEEVPSSFWRDFGISGITKEAIRVVANRMAIIDPFLRNTYRSASGILSVSDNTAKYLHRLVPEINKISVLPQSGVSKEEISFMRISKNVSQKKRKIRILFVSRLIYWKGAHLAVEAFACAYRQNPNIELTILGQGPFERRIQSLVKRRNVSNAVKMIKRLPSLNDVYSLYHFHDIFLFPSLHDSGGMAPLEAMAAGLPVVCLDIGGPSQSVTTNTGIKVPCRNPLQVVHDTSQALLQLAINSDLRKKMGEEGRKHVITSHYSWKVKAEAINRYYYKTLTKC